MEVNFVLSEGYIRSETLYRSSSTRNMELSKHANIHVRSMGELLYYSLTLTFLLLEENIIIELNLVDYDMHLERFFKLFLIDSVEMIFFSFGECSFCVLSLV